MKKYLCQGETTAAGALIAQEIEVGETHDERLVVSSHGRIFHEIALSDTPELARDRFLTNALPALQELEQKARESRKRHDTAAALAPKVVVENVYVKPRLGP